MPLSPERETYPAPRAKGIEAKAVLAVLRTAALFERDVVETLKPHGLTSPQYNVLRILRGAGEAGLCRHEISDRLVNPGPDVTRLLDRLDQVGLTRRARDPNDRRQMRAHITPRGLTLLADLDSVLGALHRRQIGHLGADRLQHLIDLSTAARKS